MNLRPLTGAIPPPRCLRPDVEIRVRGGLLGLRGDAGALELDLHPPGLALALAQILARRTPLGDLAGPPGFLLTEEDLVAMRTAFEGHGLL